MIVEVDKVLPFGMFSTIIVFEGIDEETGERIRFGMDHRPAREVRQAVAEGYPVRCAVPDYMVLSRREGLVE